MKNTQIQVNLGDIGCTITKPEGFGGKHLIQHNSAELVAYGPTPSLALVNLFTVMIGQINQLNDQLDRTQEDLRKKEEELRGVYKTRDQIRALLGC